LNGGDDRMRLGSNWTQCPIFLHEAVLWCWYLLKRAHPLPKFAEDRRSMRPLILVWE
jgi:hypothetical protein